MRARLLASARNRPEARRHPRLHRADRLARPDRHARPPARAGPRGGRDDRHRHRGGRRGRRHVRGVHAEHRAGARHPQARPSSSISRRSGRATATSSRSGPSPRTARGRNSPRLGGLVEGGAVAFTDDGAPVYSAEIMRRALEYCKMFDKAVLVHAEILELTQGGVMNEGFVSMQLGPARHAGRRRGHHDLPRHRARGTDRRQSPHPARLHGRRRRSDPPGPEAGGELKAAGKQSFWISGEACPHHFILTDENAAHVRQQLQDVPAAADAERTWTRSSRG